MSLLPVPGCLLHSVTDVHVSLVGASGGVYAILGAHVAAIVIVSGSKDFNSNLRLEGERGRLCNSSLTLKPITHAAIFQHGRKKWG